MGPTGFLTKGISFSPFMRIKWPEMGDLKPLNGTNLPAPPPSLPPRHPASPLPQPIPLSVHISFSRLFSFFTRTLHLNSHVNGITANTNTTPTFLALLPYLGSRKLSKPNLTEPYPTKVVRTLSSLKPRTLATPGCISPFSSDPFPLVSTTTKCRIFRNTRRPPLATSNLL